ncbi:MAG: hypothetical protein N2559_06560, partial [Anaerolineae bacterium]|nr:hypothetical protein [Anaerolineae bacterium]
MAGQIIHFLKRVGTETRITVRIWFGFALVLYGLFLALTLTVHLRVWVSTDWDILHATQAALPRIVDVPFSLLTLLGSAEVTGIVFLLLVWRARPARRVPLILAFGGAT